MKQRLSRISPTQWTFILTTFCFLAVAFGILLRAYRLEFPNKQVFDEVYFPVFAQHYIDGTTFYDVHPPFGKFVIAVGLMLRGDNPLGWRMMPLLFGIGLIGLMAQVYYSQMKDKIGAWIVATFVALDGMFIIYSRTGLMDGVLTFFTFATYLAALNLKTLPRIFWMATLLGIAMAIKWPSVALVIPILFFAHKQKKFTPVIYSFFWSLVLYYLITLAGQYLTHADNPLEKAFLWNYDAASYHHNEESGHPWSSEWWWWPLMIRPVLFLYDGIGNGLLQVATTVGNPLLWWGSTIVVFASTYWVAAQAWAKKQKIVDNPLTPLLLGYFAFWLPWAGVQRVLFQYHYFPAYAFAILIVTWWMARLWKKSPLVVMALLVLFVAVSIFFVPFSVGWWPLTEEGVRMHTWLRSWF